LAGATGFLSDVVYLTGVVLLAGVVALIGVVGFEVASTWLIWGCEGWGTLAGFFSVSYVFFGYFPLGGYTDRLRVFYIFL
jgi:hypothetical protein